VVHAQKHSLAQCVLISWTVSVNPALGLQSTPDSLVLGYRTTKTIVPGCAMMGSTVLVRVVFHAQLWNAMLGNTGQAVPVSRIRLASAAAMGQVTPLILEVAPLSMPITAPSSVTRAIS
jgi:hypothetical protein